MEITNFGESSLQDDLAHWAEVLDRWVKSIDMGLGRSDAGPPEPGLDEADVGPGRER